MAYSNFYSAINLTVPVGRRVSRSVLLLKNIFYKHKGYKFLCFVIEQAYHILTYNIFSMVENSKNGCACAQRLFSSFNIKTI